MKKEREQFYVRLKKNNKKHIKVYSASRYDIILKSTLEILLISTVSIKVSQADTVHR